MDPTLRLSQQQSLIAQRLGPLQPPLSSQIASGLFKDISLVLKLRSLSFQLSWILHEKPCSHSLPGIYYAEVKA